MVRRRGAGTVSAVAVAVALAGCSHAPARPAGTSGPPPVVVASFNFPESELLAEIYAQALEHAGVVVRRELDLGPREMVMPALREGLIDVVPEYLGSALEALAPGATVAGETAAAERSGLSDALRPWHVEVLGDAPAQDQNGLAVTEATASRLGLRTTSDLVSAAPRLTLGGPTECPTRPLCGVGLRDVYGLRFGRFDPFDVESQRITALREGIVDVAVLFTTDGVLATGELVLLDDDRGLQPSENVTPLVSQRVLETYGARIRTALDAVSSRLTTADLRFLNWRIGPDGQPIAAEARGWLQRHGLVPKAGAPHGV